MTEWISFIGLVGTSEEPLQMVGLVLEELYLLQPLLVVCDLLLLDLPLHQFLLLFQLLALLVQLLLSLRQLDHLLLQLRSPLLRLQLFPHPERHRALIQSLVSRDRHLQLVPYSFQKQASLGAVDCHLPNYLVETLVVEFLSDGANSRLP